MEIQPNYQATVMNDITVKSARCTHWVCSGALVLPAGSRCSTCSLIKQPRHLNLHSSERLAPVSLPLAHEAWCPTERHHHSHFVALCVSSGWDTGTVGVRGLLATSQRTAARHGILGQRWEAVRLLNRTSVAVIPAACLLWSRSTSTSTIRHAVLQWLELRWEKCTETDFIFHIVVDICMWLLHVDKLIYNFDTMQYLSRIDMHNTSGLHSASIWTGSILHAG